MEKMVCHLLCILNLMQKINNHLEKIKMESVNVQKCEIRESLLSHCRAKVSFYSSQGRKGSFSCSRGNAKSHGYLQASEQYWKSLWYSRKFDFGKSCVRMVVVWFTRFDIQK